MADRAGNIMPKVRAVPHGGSSSPRLGWNVKTTRVWISRVEMWEKKGGVGGWGGRGQDRDLGVWTRGGDLPPLPWVSV